MSAMTYKGYSARIEFDAEDEVFVGHIAGTKDIIGFHADTVDALKTAFHEAVDDYIETCEKIGKDPEKPFSGKMMLRVAPETHRKAALSAELAGISFNQWAEIALTKASEEAPGTRMSAASKVKLVAPKRARFPRRSITSAPPKANAGRK